jgi:hypothetical protein
MKMKKMAPNKNDRTRGHTLPDDIVRRLNTMGLGGRTVYIPLISEDVDFRQAIVQRMVDDLLRGVFDRSAYHHEFGRRRSARSLDRYYAEALRIAKERRRSQRQLGEPHNGNGDDAGRKVASFLNTGRSDA